MCKYKSGQKWEPETVSEIECFHSPALDMDYVFFFFLSVNGGYLRATCCEGGDCEKVCRLKVGWGVLGR